MNLKVEIHEVNGHLSIKAVGQYSLANLCDLFARAKEESEKRADRGVILDVTEVAGTIPIMDMHVLGEYCAKVWKLQFRVAIVTPAEGLNKFFETVARNRGVQIMVVPNESQAAQWVHCDQ